jgi:hypothetical protein
MKRRLFQLGLGAAALLALAGGGLALLRPGLVNGKLSPSSRTLMRSLALAVLDGAWPAAAAREAQLQAHLDQLDLAIAGLPDRVQAELSQLLALLSSSGGRLALTGLQSDWQQASVAEVTQALQAMRESTLDMRQQIYQALRELHCAVFFTEASHWPLVGYPGPKEIA